MTNGARLRPEQEHLITTLIDAAESAARILNRLRAVVQQGTYQVEEPRRLEQLKNLGARLDELVNRQMVTGLSLEAVAKELRRAVRDGDMERLEGLQEEFALVLTALPAEIGQATTELNAIVDALDGGGDANG